MAPDGGTAGVPERWLVVSVALPADDDGRVAEGLLALGGGPWRSGTGGR